jgi:hypothetical protein
MFGLRFLFEELVLPPSIERHHVITTTLQTLKQLMGAMIEGLE